MTQDSLTNNAAVSGTAKSSKATFALVCVLAAASACLQQCLAAAVVSNKISFLASRIFSRRRQDLPLAEICQYKVIHPKFYTHLKKAAQECHLGR